LDQRGKSLEARRVMSSLKQVDVSKLTESDIEMLAARLEKDDYTDAFEGLNDWHLLRAIAFQRPELVEPYLYLLDLEAFDES
jgi:hypothetical protein